MFKRYNSKKTIFQQQKKRRLFWLKIRTNLTADTYRMSFNKKNCFTVEKLWRFGLFSRDKGNKNDTWMIKIAIKANQIDMSVFLISK